ncbi:tRNA (guanine(26)-N(2))-dimethyltransferase isoform X2 [Cryptomeria japonica]|uniref:tRNA (guanine(26)-N(2))-dimethyltransferase isoform X2 n=1 Tax=Cryptomeria japonica TaxID=3369 RepID=UPI0027DA55A2|nr:tRNA (guanine(26)-N(2))-dimethyltransferase isoform X2 [Cryptomeria japonica]
MRLLSLYRGRGVVECTSRSVSIGREEEERGVRFAAGEGFFRKESRDGRDLGVLAAAVYRRKTGRLRVMDAMCGCGVRALRYLAQANADFVWANDANEDTCSTILSNLSNIPTSKWFLSHEDANRLMCQRYLLHDYYDLIDIDSFGSASSFFASALSAIRHDGLLYLTSTDGFSSGGHRPHNALTSYGAFIRPMPYANEIGLRMLIGGAVREAATRNMNARPVFSLFSYHGPVFRVMLQVAHGKPLKNRHYGFISYCRICGDSHAFSWENMGQIFCPCSERKDKSHSLVVSGPLWIGPLHSGIEIHEMLELAEEWGWTMKEKCSSTGKNADLKKLLTIMLEESTPGLPFGYIKLDEEGYVASRSHIAANVIKTNCPIRDCIKIANIH